MSKVVFTPREQNALESLGTVSSDYILESAHAGVALSWIAAGWNTNASVIAYWLEQRYGAGWQTASVKRKPVKTPRYVWRKRGGKFEKHKTYKCTGTH